MRPEASHPIVPARKPVLLVPLAFVVAGLALALAASLRDAHLPLAVRVVPWAAVALVLALLAVSMRGARHGRVVLAPEGLRLRGDVYGRRAIPYADLAVDRARVVDMRHEPPLQLRLRLLGTVLPGYSAGWFRLGSGERALCALTARDRVLHLPTRRGYALLLSVADPDALLAALRARTPPAIAPPAAAR